MLALLVLGLALGGVVGGALSAEKPVAAQAPVVRVEVCQVVVPAMVTSKEAIVATAQPGLVCPKWAPETKVTPEPTPGLSERKSK